MSQLVDSHSTSIKKLEYHIGHLSITFDQQKSNALPSDTVQNLRSNGSFLAITTTSGKVFFGPQPMVQTQVDDLADNDKIVDDAIRVDDVLTVAKKKDAKKSVNLKNNNAENKKKSKQVLKPLTQWPRPPPLLPYRVKQNMEDGKFNKFPPMLMELLINISLVEALEQLPGYANFMKDLVRKKRKESYDLVDNLHTAVGSLHACWSKRNWIQGNSLSYA